MLRDLNAAKAGAKTYMGSIWPAPDMSILSAGRAAPVSVPPEMFGSVWGLLCDLAEGAGAPVDYTAMAFTVAGASLIGGKRYVSPWGGWSEACILWGACVGDPSTNKSPALDSVVNPFRRIEADHTQAHAEALLQYEATVERAKAESAAWVENVKTAQKDGLGTPSKPVEAVIPDEPVRRRLVVQDATPEAVGSILSGNPSGTMMLRDELAGWLQSFDRYSPGGREFWLEAYGGRPLTIDRKGNKAPISIGFTGVSVCGGIQPEKLSECLFGGADDGLVPRFLWAWPNNIEFRRPRSIADTMRLEQIFRRIDSIRWGVGLDGSPVPITISLDPAAANLFEEWARENDRGIEDSGALFKGFCGKLRGTVLRLSLVAEYVRWADGPPDADEPEAVGVETLASVIEYVESYGKPMALRVFGDAALPPVERNAATLGRYIRREKLRSINASHLRRNIRLPGLRDADAVSDAIKLLIDADWLRDSGSRQGDTHGRRSSDFDINPAVHGGA